MINRLLHVYILNIAHMIVNCNKIITMSKAPHVELGKFLLKSDFCSSVERIKISAESYLFMSSSGTKR